MNKRIISLSIIGALLIMLVATSISYAVWVTSSTQEDENIASSGCFNVELNSSTEGLLVENDFPKIDEDGMKRDPYSFSIENTCATYAAYQIKVEVLSDNTLPSNLTKLSLNDDIYLLSTLENTDNNFYVLETDYLAAGEVKEYDFRQWFDESGTLENSQNKRISTRIVLESVAANPPYKETLLAGNDPVLNSGFVPVVIESDGTVKKADLYSEWYSYEDKEWANAVTVNSESLRNADAGTEIPMDNIEEMYVWIPRYDYDADTIVDVQHAIDITFVDTETDAHPAFTVEGTELKGMWIGKFEMGFKDGENETTADVEYVVKPNLNSVHSTNISTMFAKIANINNTNNLDSTIDVHMMKNTEWGMVAYLSQSVYGVCTSVTECEKIDDNSYFDGYFEYNIVTGCGSSNTGIISSEVGINICPEINRWTTENGMHASTTRNITGIYDMAGGRDESVMGIMQNSSGSLNLKNEGFTTVPDAKYYDVYANGSSKTDYTRGLSGDATIELSPSGHSMSNWNDDYADFVSSSHNWFKRGHDIGVNSNGIWTFTCFDNRASISITSRVAAWVY